MRELLDLALRWIHVIAAIMWIGNSLLFNWLDRNLAAAAKPRGRSAGAAWLLHSGGFYYAEKTFALDDGVDMRAVHWFKWQAYTTWLSGAALLALLYYHSARSLLVAPDAPLGAGQGIALSIAVLGGGWLLYDVLWNSPLKRTPRAAAALCFALLLVLAWGLTQVFTGRAAFLHVGALMATIMAGNVKLHIMPAQREFVAALERGTPADERLPQRAKLRSIHNNYLTFPVVVLMLSSHFPALYSRATGWLAIGVLIVAGAGIRHILNVRYTFAYWVPALGAAIIATLLALHPLMQRPAVATVVGDEELLTDAEAFALVQKRCTVCHSASPADRSLGTPAGVVFDTPEQVNMLLPRIEARAIHDRTMPPDNRTWMTDDERARLGRWIREAR